MGFEVDNKGPNIYFLADFDGIKIVGKIKGGIDGSTRLRKKISSSMKRKNL
jgi:hypothetical protein